MSWVSVFIFFIISALALWLSYNFLNKNGLYLFCIITSMLSMFLTTAVMFSLPIHFDLVLFPIMFLAIIVCANKFGSAEALKLFVITIITQAIFFVFAFVQGLFLDVAIGLKVYISWEVLSVFVVQLIAFSAAGISLYFLVKYLSLNKVNKNIKIAIQIACASAVSSTICAFIGYIGMLSFGKILLVWLLRLVLLAVFSIGLGYFELLLNKKFSVKLIGEEANGNSDVEEVGNKNDNTSSDEKKLDNKDKDLENGENNEEVEKKEKPKKNSKNKEETEEEVVNYDNL